MQEWIISTIDQFGYFGIALMIAVENIFPPIPSEVILTFGGFMTTHTTMNLWMVAFSATIGSVVGAMVLYGIGRLVHIEKIEWIIARWGHILGLKKEDVRRAESWFTRKGQITVFFCRFVPLIRSLISIPAGMAHMSIKRFLLYTTTGTAIWNVVLVYLGQLAGENWKYVDEQINAYSDIVLIGLAIGCVIFAAWFLKRRKFNPRKQEKQAKAAKQKPED